MTVKLTDQFQSYHVHTSGCVFRAAVGDWIEVRRAEILEVASQAA